MIFQFSLHYALSHRLEFDRSFLLLTAFWRGSAIRSSHFVQFRPSSNISPPISAGEVVAFSLDIMLDVPANGQREREREKEKERERERERGERERERERERVGFFFLKTDQVIFSLPGALSFLLFVSLNQTAMPRF